MMSNCRYSMLSLVLVLVAMLVQDTVQQPAPVEATPAAATPTIKPLIDTNPFYEMPQELNIPEFKPSDPNQVKQLQELALFGLNKIREVNGVNSKLASNELVLKSSNEEAEKLCNTLLKDKENFNFDAWRPEKIAFTRHVSFGTLEELETTSTSEVVVKSVKDWYLRMQDKVKEGVNKEAIATLDPNTKYFGLGLSIKEGELEGKKVTYYAIILDLATNEEFEKFEKEVKP